MSTKARPWAWVPTLYFAEGIPYAIVTTLTVVMYKQMGLDNTRLALYTSILTLPWVIKPLWSPIVDIFSSKRRWILLMEFLIAAALMAVALTLPGPMWLSVTIASFLAVAFLSATHDISADGFYILSLPATSQSAFVGIRTTFYRIAMLLGQGPVLILAGTLEVSYGDIPRAWALMFEILAAVYALFAFYHIWALPHAVRDNSRKATSVREVGRAFASSFVGFFRRPHIITILAFLLLYKFPIAQLQRLVSPFLLDSTQNGGLGLSTIEVGFGYGTLGIIGLLAGGIAGGLAIARGTLRQWLIPMAWTLTASCGAMAILALTPQPSLTQIYLCVVAEQFGYGFSTTAYIMYCIHISRGEFATSHYAIATGIMSLGMMLPGMMAGAIEEAVGYSNFFIITCLSCFITLTVAYFAKKQFAM